MSRPVNPGTPLTPRELQVMRGLARGLTYKGIAAAEHLSISTIRTHAHNAYHRLGAHDATSGVLAYLLTAQAVMPAARELHKLQPDVGVQAWARTIHLVLQLVTRDLGVEQDTPPAWELPSQPPARPQPPAVPPRPPLPPPARPDGAGERERITLATLRARYAARRADVMRRFDDDDAVADVLGWSPADEAIAAVRMAYRSVGRFAGTVNGRRAGHARSVMGALVDAETDTLLMALEGDTDA